MKKTVLAGLVAVVFGLAAYAFDLGAVSFKITGQHFVEGDSIAIQEVIATSPHLKAGDAVVVRGRYRLQSQVQASLGFFLTTQGPRQPTPIEAAQQRAIQAGEGSFELVQVVAEDGALHVSFYPALGGETFGGVYFAPGVR